MSYIGQTLPADSFQGFTTDSFAGDGSATTFTLSKTPFNESALLVVINNVVQKPTTNFTVSGTTLTIVGTAVASGDVIYATHIGGALPIGQAASLDLNGASDQLILDADADTTISADTDDQIDFKTGGTDRLTIQSTSGNNVVVADGLTLTDGNLIVASGHGIDFSATGDGSGTTTSELLDDYEEGTWTPTIGNSAGSQLMALDSTYSGANKAFYTKIGNTVHVHGYIVVTGNGTHVNNATYLGGLPFAINSAASGYSALNVGYQVSMNFEEKGFDISGYFRAGGSNTNVALMISDVTGGASLLERDQISDNGQFIFSGTYHI